jgi:hypothetical protein
VKLSPTASRRIGPFFEGDDYDTKKGVKVKAGPLAGKKFCLRCGLLLDQNNSPTGKEEYDSLQRELVKEQNRKTHSGARERIVNPKTESRNAWGVVHRSIIVLGNTFNQNSW